MTIGANNVLRCCMLILNNIRLSLEHSPILNNWFLNNYRLFDNLFYWNLLLVNYWLLDKSINGSIYINWDLNFLLIVYWFFNRNFYFCFIIVINWNLHLNFFLVNDRLFNYFFERNLSFNNFFCKNFYFHRLFQVNILLHSLRIRN